MISLCVYRRFSFFYFTEIGDQTMTCFLPVAGEDCDEAASRCNESAGSRSLSLPPPNEAVSPHGMREQDLPVGEQVYGGGTNDLSHV